MRHDICRGVDSTVQCTPLFCTPSAREKVMENIEEAVNRWETPNFFVHLFSNTGYYAYVNLIQRGNICLPCKVVLDSAPYIFLSSAQFDKSINSNSQSYEDENSVDLPMAMSRVATSMILRKNVYELFPLTNILRAGLSMLDRTLGVFPPVHSFDNCFLSHHARLPIPMLFIYSQGDRIIEAEGIRKVIQALKKSHANTMAAAKTTNITTTTSHGDNNHHVAHNHDIIQHKEFGPEVPHVSSFRMYEKDYSAALDRFLFNDAFT